MYYAVTAHKPSSVLASCVGEFLGNDHRNLLLARVNRIEIYNLMAEGIVPVLELPVYGRLHVMRLFRPPGENTDFALIVTERCHLVVLRWDVQSNFLKTHYKVDLTEVVGTPSENPIMAVVDPLARCYAVHIYRSNLRIITHEPVPSVFTVRVTEEVKDLVFLHDYADKPVLAMLFGDAEKQTHIKTLQLNLREKEANEGPFSQRNLEVTASKLVAIPEPYGGLLVIGETTVAHLRKDGTFVSIHLTNAPIIVTAVGKIDPDGTRYMLGDQDGDISILQISLSPHTKETSLVIGRLGKTTVPSCLSYLDNRFVYAGSTSGDHKLLKLGEDGEDALIERDSYSNISPVVDCCVVDLEKQGQGQIVTCSGIGKDGSLRIIRNGISITEVASVEMEGIKDVFSLRRNYNEENHGYLLPTFSTQSRVLEINEEAGEMAEGSIPGLDELSQTLFAGNVIGNMILQVTPSEIRLIDCSSMMGASAPWAPPNGARINLAAANVSQILISTNDSKLFYFEVDPDGQCVVQKKSLVLENEASCLDVSPLGDDPKARAQMAAVGLWQEVTVRLVTLPDLTHIVTEPLGGLVIARSVLLCTMEGTSHLLVGLGDGHLRTYRLDLNSRDIIGDRRKVSVGTQPPTLTAFRSRDTLHVFAGCDRPTVIHASSSGNKLVCSNVNQRMVSRVRTFNATSYSDSLAIAAEDTLKIGHVDDIQKLHIRKIPLGDSPHRIAHMEESKAFGVIVSHADQVGPDDVDFFSVRLYDEGTFDELDRFEAERDEWGCSLMTMKHGEAEYLVVGMATTDGPEDESKKGRIIVFSITKLRKLVVVAEKEVSGAVHSLVPFNGKILSGVNSKLYLFFISDGEDGVNSLSEVCSHHGYIIAYRVRTHGDYILVGDLTNSSSLCIYKQVDNSIEEIARDYDSVWITDCQMVDDENFLESDGNYNLYALRRSQDDGLDDASLEKTGEFHVGELINKLTAGSLVMQQPEAESPALHTTIYGTASGGIGVIARLAKENYDEFKKIETAMAGQVISAGDLEHGKYRAIKNQRRQDPARNFLDGDLIERFLDLNATAMHDVAQACNSTAEEISKKVEEMSRMH